MMRLALLVGVLSLLAFPSFAGLDERIQVSIEEPVQGERYSGISNLRGWAVSPEGTGNYYHSVYIDGEFAYYITPYGKRTDVGNAFPDYPNSDTAGFSMAFNYKDLAPGEHEIRVRAYDNLMNYNDAIATFTTERFESSFIASDSDVDLSGLDNVFLYDDQSLLLNGANVEGKRWNFLLKWDKPSQSFKTWGIEAYTENLSGITDYEIAGSGSSDSADNTDDCANVTGYNPNCSDSSGSGDSGSSSGSDENSIGSTGYTTGSTSSGSDSGDGTGTPDPGYVCGSGYERCVYDYSSEIDIGNSGILEAKLSYRITIPERTVAVVGLSISQNGNQQGYIAFAPAAGFAGFELVLWISETPDGASVSDSCRYRGYPEGRIGLRLDDSGGCSLGAGEYFVNLTACSSEPEDSACSFEGAVMNDQDLEIILKSRYL